MEMQMEKRFVLAMILSMLFVVFYRYVFMPDSQPASTPAVQITEEKQPAEESYGAPPIPVPNPATISPTGPPPAAITEASSLDIIVDDTQYVIDVSNRGGVITSWRFLERDTTDVQLVRQENPPGAYGPLALWTADPELTRLLNTAYYEVQLPSMAFGNPARVKTPVEITFKYQGSGIRATKTLKFEPASFLVQIAVEVEKAGSPVPVQVQLGPGIGVSDEALGSDSRHQQRVALLNEANKVERVSYGDVEALQQGEEKIQWAGFESQYFTSLILPPRGSVFPSSQIRPFTWKEGDKETILPAVDVPIQPGEQYRIFFGPKEQSILRSADPILVRIIDYGWFGFIVEPLILILNWIHAGVHNYGFSIIILTFLITLALFPLRYKQMVSMKKMSKLQPQVKAIQERYKKAKKSAQERQKMNTEMMGLYKKHGVNPLGGCLPLLLQMPILFAFYQMLAVSYELRGAPFIFWIKDLAAKDPYYITPLLMGVTMLISMKITPTTASADAMQGKMMMFMPIVMTFMFLRLSAGLNLYFLFSNLFSISMQKLSERYMPAR